MKKYSLLIGFILLVVQVFGYSLLEQIDGNYVTNIDSRSAAMGGASVAGGISLFDALLNPANLTFKDSPFGAAFNLQVVKNEDKRSFPMYNFFDGYVDDATYVSNENYFNNIALGVYGTYKMDDLSFSGGLFFRPYLNFDCDYQEQVRNDENSDNDNYPPIIANNLIEGVGNINKTSFMFGLNFQNRYALGLEIGMLKGDQNMKKEIYWTDFAQQEMEPTHIEDSYMELDREFEAIEFTLGANTTVNEHLSLGISFTPSTEFDVNGNWFTHRDSLSDDGWITLTDSYDIEDIVYLYEHDMEMHEDSTYVYVETDSLMFSDLKTPTKMRFGLSFEPKNIMRTFFNADMEYVKWSDVNPFYDNVWNFYIGIEHKVNNAIPFRVGFNYVTLFQTSQRNTTVDEVDYTLYFGDKITIPTFSLGTGFTFLDRFTLDISAEISNRNYETLDMFPDGFYGYDELWQNLDPADRGWENPDTVNETITQLKTQISFDW